MNLSLPLAIERGLEYNLVDNIKQQLFHPCGIHSSEWFFLPIYHRDVIWSQLVMSTCKA